MPIDFTCPNCSHRSMVADQYAGHSGPCSQCGQTIRIPVPGQLLGQQPGQPTQPPPQPPNPYADPMGGAGNQHFPNGPGYPPQQGYPPPPPRSQSDAGLRMLIPVDRSILSIIAGYFGLFSVLCLPAPIALLLGILAIRDIKKNPGKHGMGRAIFAVVMGSIFTLLLLFGVVGMFLDSMN